MTAAIVSIILASSIPPPELVKIRELELPDSRASDRSKAAANWKVGFYSDAGSADAKVFLSTAEATPPSSSSSMVRSRSTPEAGQLTPL